MYFAWIGSLENDKPHYYMIHSPEFLIEYDNVGFQNDGNHIHAIFRETGNDFGEDIQILSDFIEAPAMFLNYYMKRAKITDYSVFEVEYEPKFKTHPCDKTSFDFKININNIIPVTKSQTLDVFESRDHSIYLISGIVCDNEDFLTHSVVTLNVSNFNQLMTVA